MTILRKECSLSTCDISVDALVANVNNTNEMTEATLNRLTQEIVDVGMMVPLNVIPIGPDRYLILGGEHRWLAAKKCGMTFVPCIVHSDDRWKDIDQVDLQNFKLNAIHGKINGEKFFKLYQRLCERIGHEKVQEALAVTDNTDWKKLTKGVEQGLKESGAPQAVLDQVKEAEKRSRGPEDLSKKLNKILKDHAESMVANNVLMFQSGGSEHALIRASEIVFGSVKRIVDYANKHNQDVNVLLAPSLSSLADRLESVQ